MATRSQRRKEKQKQKRKRKKEQQRKRQAQFRQPVGTPPVGDARQVLRVSQQQPQAWPGETPEDVAVFDDAVLATLPSESSEQVTAIRDALRLACDLRGAEALERVSGIARSSPLSQWRLFLRGLVAWVANDQQAAGETWKRLDPQRRPGRMAIAMMNSLRSDLQHASARQGAAESDEAAPTAWSGELDDQLLYHAKLLRRVRFDRTAIRIAQAGLRSPEEAQDLRLGPRKIEWLKQFVTEHRKTEPDLTAALQQVALGRAFSQPYSDVFDLAAAAFQGPRHDRRNLLLSFFYYAMFQGDAGAQRKADRALQEYLERDLPNNSELSESLRGAIASLIHLREAKMAIRPPARGMFSFFPAPEDTQAIRKHLAAAMSAFPANRAACKTYIDWLETKLENDRLTKPKREPLLKEQAGVMARWSQALPDDVKPRLWLVDYLLEREQTEQAKPHVDWLAAARQDDPRVRATPWKWQLLEAMRLCRRKAWLKDVQPRLEEAARLWPAWLSREWLPYLKAAVALRAGNADEYEDQRQQICQELGVPRDCLSDACMMLGAAQHMRVPASDLKPLRAPVDRAVKNLGRLSDEEVLSVSGFFWDLHRTGLRYPAYRMHGGKIVDEIFACLKENPQWVSKCLDDERIHAAILLCSEHRCLDNGYELTLPDWYSQPAVKQHPMFAAAKLNAVLKMRYPWLAQRYEELGGQVRELAPSQRDSYYRHWFASLADELDEVLASESSRRGGFGFNPLDFMFGGDDEGDAFDEDLGFDPDCDCPECRAARRAYEASQR